MNFELIGTLIALAIYNSVLLDLPLPTVVFKKLLDEKVGIEDIKEFDPAFYTTLKNILKSDQCSEMDLTFSITFDFFGEEQTVDFKENGRNIQVTNENKEEFVELYVDWYLNRAVKEQFEPFYQGFYKVISHESIQVSESLRSSSTARKSCT
jgi:ubiquitin-protein ligase E3 A